jgi:hypothetical protein
MGKGIDQAEVDEFSLSNSRTGTWFFWAARRTPSLDDLRRAARSAADVAWTTSLSDESSEESRARFFAADFRAGFLAAGLRAFFTDDGSDDLRRASINACGSEDSL